MIQRPLTRCSRRRSTNKPALLRGIHLALLADELGDAAERDATLGKLAARVMFTDKSKVEPVVQPLLDLSKWLAKAYQQPADAELDTAALDEILKTDQKQPR